MKKIPILLIILLTSCATYIHIPSLNLDKEIIKQEEIISSYTNSIDIKKPYSVMWYNLGDDVFYKNLMITNDNVKNNSELPKELMQGYKEEAKDIFGLYPKLNIKYLRFLSATSKCDYLMLCGTKFLQIVEPNWSSMFNIFVVPIFCVPYLNAKYEYLVDLYMIDVRNGSIKYFTYKTNITYNYVFPYQIKECENKTRIIVTNDATKRFDKIY